MAALAALPDPILRRIAAYLDAPAMNNWKTILALLPEYTQKDVNAFSTLGKKKSGSASMALLHDLQSRGYTIGELSRLALDAKLGVITDILTEYCRAKGLDIHSKDVPAKSARSCYDRIAPLGPPCLASEPDSTRDEHQLVQVRYSTLLDITTQFDQVPYHKGGHKLGEGGFGEVFYCRMKLPDNREIELAAKVLNKMSRAESKFYNNELSVLSVLSHDCLLPLFGFSSDGAHLCLLYPFMPHGSLDRHIKDLYVLPPSQRVGVARDVARALAYMHNGVPSRVIIHRDVKSANVLLTQDWKAKLGDFGVVRLQQSPDTTVTAQVVGTMIYMSPECAQGLITPAADVFAFGVVLYELLTGLLAERADESGTDLLTAVEDNDSEPDKMILGHWACGKDVWQLAGECTDHNHRKRPTSDKVAAALELLAK